MPITDQERAAVASLLVHHSLIGVDDAYRILSGDEPPGPALRQLVPEGRLLRAAAAEIGVELVDLRAAGERRYRADQELAERADADRLRRFHALPLVAADGEIVAALADPSNVDVIGYLESVYGQVRVVLASAEQITAELVRMAQAADEVKDDNAARSAGEQQLVAAPPAAARRPVEDWIDTTLERAVADRASDVALMFRGDGTLLVRARVDGALRQLPPPGELRPDEVVRALLSRCATIDAFNTNEPADGTFSFRTAGKNVDVRVGMLPQAYGPTVVARILDSTANRMPLDELITDGEALRTIRKALQSKQGGIIASGPTGAGKTTTLYAMLREIDARTRHVLTVEDPIEYRLPNIGQTQIRSDIGDKSLTFPRALRAILRMSPDVILVGEARDAETARVTMEAAITGLLVLGTSHANDAVGVYARFADMGVPGYIVGEGLDLSIAQRLVRRVHDCAGQRPPSRTEADSLNEIGLAPPDRVPQPTGCPGCGGVGYHGMVAFMEVLRPSQEMRTLVNRDAEPDRIRRAARDTGYATLAESGLALVAGGLTTLDEVLSTIDQRAAAADAR